MMPSPKRTRLLRGMVPVMSALIAATPAAAVTVQTWSASTATEFELGTMDGVVVDESGRLRVSRSSETVWGPAAGIVWSVSAGPNGDAFIGLSSPGRLLHVTADGEPEIWYETGEDSLIAAVAADESGGVYFGLSPEGTVFHATGQGAVTEVASTQAKFVWSLAASEDGTVWIGTGLPGNVMRLMTDGEALRVFDTEDDPVRCITPLAGGGVLVGTGGRGRVVRIDSDGRPFVLLDAEEAEIVSLVSRADGTVFALAAKSTKQVSSAPSPAVVGAVETIRVTANGPSDDNGGSKEERPRQPEPRPAPRSFKMTGGGALYRIAAGGGTRRIWDSTREVPFMLAPGRDGKLLMATGDEGRVYEIDERGRTAVLLSIGSEQASAVVAGPDGTVYVGGTTDARLDRIGPRLRKAGSYLVVPIDAGDVADWGSVAWDAEVPRGSGVQLYARAGNTATPDGTWSEWTAVEPVGEGKGLAAVAAARWMQLRIDMQPSHGNETPLLGALEVRYRTHNRRPAIENLIVQPAGVVWTRTPVQSTRSRGPLVADDPVARKVAAALQGAKISQPVRKSYELGARTFSWEASDPDDDRLFFTVEIRRTEADAWIPLVRDLDETHYSFDTRGMPDGFYRARLSATDGKDNPEGQGLEDVLTSAVFQIDNTRPAVARRRVNREGEDIEIEFVATDPGGNVAAVEVAVDGGEWRPVDPLDGVADSPEERYRMVIGAGEWTSPGARTLRVRVTDAAGNLGGDAWSLE